MTDAPASFQTEPEYVPAGYSWIWRDYVNARPDLKHQSVSVALRVDALLGRLKSEAMWFSTAKLSVMWRMSEDSIGKHLAVLVDAGLLERDDVEHATPTYRRMYPHGQAEAKAAVIGFEAEVKVEYAEKVETRAAKDRKRHGRTEPVAKPVVRSAPLVTSETVEINGRSIEVVIDLSGEDHDEDARERGKRVNQEAEDIISNVLTEHDDLLSARGAQHLIAKATSSSLRPLRDAIASDLRRGRSYSLISDDFRAALADVCNSDLHQDALAKLHALRAANAEAITEAEVARTAGAVNKGWLDYIGAMLDAVAEQLRTGRRAVAA